MEDFDKKYRVDRWTQYFDKICSPYIIKYSKIIDVFVSFYYHLKNKQKKAEKRQRRLKLAAPSAGNDHISWLKLCPDKFKNK